MIKTEITTKSGQRVVISFPKASNKAVAHNTVIDSLKAGYGIEGDDQIVTVWGQPEIIRTWDVTEDIEAESTEDTLEGPTTDEQPQGNTKYRVIPIKTKYVGQDVLIRVLEYTPEDNELIYWLPLTVNGFPPSEAINAEALAKLLTQVCTYGMGFNPGDVVIITPPADLPDEALALDYIEDYIKACKDVHKVEKKTAKAWLGHRLEGQEG